MNSDKGREEWINSVLGSTNGMQRAQPRGPVYDRAMAALAWPDSNQGRPVFVRWAAAAVLLVVINVASVYYYNNSTKEQTSSGTNPVAAELESVAVYNY